MSNTTQHPVLLFDGVCNLCNGFVQFTIKRDPDAKYQFAALQSEAGQNLLEQIGFEGREELSTVVLVEGDRFYTHSDVGLRMVKDLGSAWPLLQVFKIIPKGIRDRIYNWVARNRYRWFGKKEACWIPTPDLQQRFL